MTFSSSGKPAALFIGFALLAGMLLFGCLGGGAPQGAAANKTLQPAGGGATATPAPNFDFKDPELKALYAASQAAVPPKTSLDKLQAAYDAKKISKEDYVVYSLRATLDKKSLPSGYAGEAPLENYDVSSEAMLAIDEWASLSAEAKAKLEPLLLLPGEEALPNDLKKATQTGERVLSFAGESYETFIMQAIPGKAKILGFLPSNYSQFDKDLMDTEMGWIKKGAIDAYDKFHSLLGVEPTEEVWFYWESLQSGTLGLAQMRTMTTDPVYRCRLTIDVNQTLNEDPTKSITAHELFHCFQYHVPLRDWNGAEQKWLREATAT